MKPESTVHSTPRGPQEDPKTVATTHRIPVPTPQFLETVMIAWSQARWPTVRTTISWSGS